MKVFTRKTFYLAALLFGLSTWLSAELTEELGSIGPAELHIPEGSMSLNEAFRIALENNPSIDQVESRVANAEATIKRARSYLFPSLSFSASHQYGNATMQPDWLTSVRATENFNQSNAGLSFSWKLFDGLQDIHYLRAARKGLESAKQGHKEAQRILKNQVSQAFINSELAKEQMRIAKSNYDFNSKLESDAQHRFDVGQIPEADVLNFSLALIQAETAFEQAKRDYGLACTVIAQLLAVEGSALPDSLLPKSDLSSIDKVVPTYDEAMGKAMQLRPDLKAAEAAVEAYQHQVDALKGRFMPSVSLFGGIRYTKVNDVGTVDQDEHDSNIGVRMNWSLFDGGRRKAQVLEMRASRNEMFSQQELLVDSISSEIRQRLLELETSKVLLEKSIRAEAHGRKIRDFVEKAYSAGSASITRLNEAQNNWVRTSSALSAARLQILLQQYKLKTATGEIL